MSFDTDAIRANTDIVAVARAYTALKKTGVEYCGPCPIHGGDGDNFYVNPAKRIWSCFSHGCHECEEGNDVIGFLRRVEGLSFIQACERLGATSEWKPAAALTNKAPPKPDRVTSKPPPDAGEPRMEIKQFGAPSRTWCYRDADGEPLGYVARYDPPDGKQIRCWTWGSRGTESGWGCFHWTKPRPLYGLDRLAARTGAPVVMVEGEKAADAAQALLGQMVVITWPGGSQAWQNANFEPLRARGVLLWPDNDIPGLECMGKLAAILADPRGLACKVRVLDPTGMPEGFDAADFVGTASDLITWSRPRIKDYELPAPESAKVIPIEPPKDEAPPLEAYADDLAAQRAKQRQRPRLAAVDGNAALAPEENTENLPASMSEDMLAEHFASVHSRKWRYVKPWASWFEWREDGWYRDDTAKVDRLAVEVTRQAIYWPEAATMTPDGKRKVNSKRTAGNLRDLAISDRRIAATVDQWDTDPWLLGVPGGVVDLKTGELADPRPEDYLTKRTRVAPAAGDAPIWRQFLATVANERPELISFLQRFAGYSLTGETREQCLAFLYGTGQNGKGVFITTLSNILGDYAVTADADVFMESDQARHPTEMARLRGARLVTVDETDSSKRWNEKRVKRITGGGRIEARFMRQDDFEFTPQFKLLIAGNHKPQLRGVGKAIQRRIHLVPFTVTIPDRDRDDELSSKLEAEYPVILQWMLDGCAQWREHGLSAPPEVLEATSRYIESEDVIGEWIDERCEQTGDTARPIAYKNYRAWVESRGERPWSSKAFKAAIEERGFNEVKRVGVWYITGLSLRSAGPDSEPPSYPYDE